MVDPDGLPVEVVPSLPDGAVVRPDRPTAGPLMSRGFRYLTVQVAEVVAEHERLVGMGFTEAVKPIRLGEVAAISFVRDPGGNPLEISQRASLTGNLPTDL